MKNRILTVLSFLFLTTTVLAKHEHREHSAHAHGSATLAIAFDGPKGKVEFKGAAESILGFEHKARSAKDKKTLTEATAHFENGIAKLIQFESELSCQWTRELVGQVPEKGEEGSGEHSDWAANFTVACSKSPLGTKLIIDFSSFKRLKDLDVTVLMGSLQKNAEFSGKPLTIELK